MEIYYEWTKMRKDKREYKLYHHPIDLLRDYFVRFLTSVFYKKKGKFILPPWLFNFCLLSPLTINWNTCPHIPNVTQFIQLSFFIQNLNVKSYEPTLTLFFWHQKKGSFDIYSQTRYFKSVHKPPPPPPLLDLKEERKRVREERTTVAATTKFMLHYQPPPTINKNLYSITPFKLLFEIFRSLNFL